MKLAKSIMTTSPITEVEVPSIPVGTKMGGGYWFGRIQVGALQYDLIVSSNPMAGDYDDASWSIEAREPYTYWEYDIEYNESLNDGWGIVQGAQATGIQWGALEVFSGITVQGHSDWYPPCFYELEIMYRNLKPGTTPNVTTVGTNPSSVPASTSNYTASSPGQTTVASFKTGGANALRADIYQSSSRGPSGKTYYRTISFIDGSVGESINTDGNWSRAIRRQLVAA